MADSFVDFRGRCYQRTDREIAIVAGLIVRTSLHRSSAAGESSALRNLFDYWRVHFPAMGSAGSVSPKLDEYLKAQADVDALLLLVAQARESVASFGETMPGDAVSEAALYVLGYKPQWNELPVATVLAWIDEWHKLLTGQGGIKKTK